MSRKLLVADLLCGAGGSSTGCARPNGRCRSKADSGAERYQEGGVNLTEAALIERLEKLSRPDRATDREVLRVTAGRVVRDETFIYGRKHGTREIEKAYPYKIFCWFAPRYTRSVDAASAIVPKRWWWSCGHCEREEHASVGREIATSKEDESIDGFGATPAIALCIAAIKAIARNDASG